MDLLRHQWPPPIAFPPMASIEFWCPPNNTAACTRREDGTLLLSTCIGEEGELTAQISVAPTRHNDPRGYISDLTLDSRTDMENKIANCLQAAAVTGTQGAAPQDLDASPCEHIVSLKMSMLDTIQAFYIKALARMPSCSPQLLRALLVAGHCYGPMDPVSNSIINSAWYGLAFPLAPGTELPHGILDSRLMARMASRSLSGFVAILRATGGGKSSERSTRPYSISTLGGAMRPLYMYITIPCCLWR